METRIYIQGHSGKPLYTTVKLHVSFISCRAAPMTIAAINDTVMISLWAHEPACIYEDAMGLTISSDPLISDAAGRMVAQWTAKEVTA